MSGIEEHWSVLEDLIATRPPQLDSALVGIRTEVMKLSEGRRALRDAELDEERAMAKLHRLGRRISDLRRRAGMQSDVVEALVATPDFHRWKTSRTGG